MRADHVATRIAYFLSCVVLAATATRAAPASIEEAQRAGLDELRLLSRDWPAVHFEGAVATSVGARVPFDAVGASSDPIDSAVRYLDWFAALYQLDVKSLFVDRIVDSDDGTRVFFGQQRDGVIVAGASLVVFVGFEEVYGSVGRYLETAPAFTGPVLSADAAGTAAIDAVGGGAARGVPVPVIFAPELFFSKEEREAHKLDRAPQPAYRVTVEASFETAVPTTTFFVSARDGSVLVSVPHQVDVDLRVRGGGVQGLFCSSSGTDWFTEAGIVPGATPHAEGFVTRDTALAWHSRQLATFGRDSYDAMGAQMDALVRNADPAVKGNAWWEPDCKRLVFSPGFAVDDVLAHELTHAVVDATSALVYQGQSGALNEHYADLEAVLHDRGDWTIGEDTGLGAFRDFSDPTKSRGGGQPDRMSRFVVTTGDNGGVHINSGILNKALWLLLNGGNHNAIHVNAIGRSKVETFFQEVVTTMMPMTATFQMYADTSVNTSVIFSLIGKHGLTAKDTCQIRNAFAAVELAVPDVDCDTNPDPERDRDFDERGDDHDNCPDAFNPGQGDLNGDGQGDACDEDVDGDGVLNTFDNCVYVANSDQKNSGGTRTGDACEDRDRDGVKDAHDNCPDYGNALQGDSDLDGIGDDCDVDGDGDGFKNFDDNCPAVSNSGQQDGDGDKIGDACDLCPGVAGGARDGDHDGLGDECDGDLDNDGVVNERDNCPTVANAIQIDVDHDGQGDACDTVAVGTVIYPSLEVILRGRAESFERFASPFHPCLGGVCPMGIGGPFANHIAVKASVSMIARIVDADGRILAIAGPSTSLSLSFTPKMPFVPGDESLPLPSQQPTLELFAAEPFKEAWVGIEGGAPKP